MKLAPRTVCKNDISLFHVHSEKLETIRSYKKLTMEVTFHKLFREINAEHLAFTECVARYRALQELLDYIKTSKCLSWPRSFFQCSKLIFYLARLAPQHSQHSQTIKFKSTTSRRCRRCGAVRDCCRCTTFRAGCLWSVSTKFKPLLRCSWVTAFGLWRIIYQRQGFSVLPSRPVVPWKRQSGKAGWLSVGEHNGVV